MTQTMTAKLFRNGASQAVRLPAEFRFKGTEVFISRDAVTGNVILSERPGSDAWAEFFASRPVGKEVDEYLSERPMNQIPVERDIFGLDEEA
jgi:antitoxin VapB